MSTSSVSRFRWLTASAVAALLLAGGTVALPPASADTKTFKPPRSAEGHIKSMKVAFSKKALRIDVTMGKPKLPIEMLYVDLHSSKSSCCPSHTVEWNRSNGILVQRSAPGSFETIPCPGARGGVRAHGRIVWFSIPSRCLTFVTDEVGGTRPVTKVFPQVSVVCRGRMGEDWSFAPTSDDGHPFGGVRRG